ncbi:MAG: YheU family protein [Thiotrichaceae bacterium]|nr:YheU family protein [Thiotrichaceae bacterium]
MLIPFEQLSPDALRGLVEDFVTRNGTDYGDIEVSLETKIKQVMRQLKSGEVVIAYNHDEEYCNIITKEDACNILEQKKEHPI